ncbi:hypothetical protein LM7423_480004 [Listeria monocytogenes]|nr:hypothetical protein LM7423_480004 [Listeria monocytogenes]CUL91100.1 hypothetical protein LM7425_440004 [Listeria monocytogenes]
MGYEDGNAKSYMLEKYGERPEIKDFEEEDE